MSFILVNSTSTYTTICKEQRKELLFLFHIQLFFTNLIHIYIYIYLNYYYLLINNNGK